MQQVAKEPLCRTILLYIASMAASTSFVAEQGKSIYCKNPLLVGNYESAWIYLRDYGCD